MAAWATASRPGVHPSPRWRSEDVVTKLNAWEEAWGVTIWSADVESVTFDLTRQPKDPRSCAEDLYAFCPDIVDQGVGTVDALIQHLGESGSLYLWWD